MHSSAWRFLALTLLAMLAVLGGGFFLQAGMLGWGWVDLDMGTVPDWMAAGGTAVAVVAVLYTAKGYKLDSESRRRAEAIRLESERRLQADLIAGWVEREEDVPCVVDDVWQEVRQAIVLVANASEGVVYDVQIRLMCDPVAQAPGDRYRMRELRAFGYLRELPPGTWGVHMELGSTSVTVDTIDIHFRDQRAVQWSRDTAGVLTETTKRPFPLAPLRGPWPSHASADDLTERERDLILRTESPTYVPTQILERFKD